MATAVESLCAICMGSSGKPLSGKRCTATKCKDEYAARRKQARASEEPASASPVNAASCMTQSVEVESINHFKLWEVLQIYGRRIHDPEKFSNYELRNGVSEGREEELAYLVHSHWKEDINDHGRSVCTWVLLEDIVRSLKDEELSVLDTYEENNPSQHWEAARAGFREAHADAGDL